MESNTNEPLEPARIEQAYLQARAALFADRTPQGHWTGELSTSALSTATAISALTLVLESIKVQGSDAPHSVEELSALSAGGIVWLAQHQNEDGGFGDTTKSLSNISTSMLVKAAFHIAGAAKQHPELMGRLEEYLQKQCGATMAEQAEAIRARYGKDRTFAVPILMNCALAGLVPWREVLPLPFELACFPQSWFRFLKLPVVSYALPALIAVGLVIHLHRGAWFPFNLIRRLAIPRALRVLEKIQPSSGGFLEATPLTSFVTMSLAASGRADHPVARKGIEFIVASVRPDGSWPIDSNLATFVTTLAVNALAEADDLDSLDDKEAIRDWLLKQQFTQRHPYTGADPGGWGWTDLPGSVPDADDTPGAILALSNLTWNHSLPGGAMDGLRWLMDVQNSDGGWPTFCRGWGTLPFDRSGSDLTAHALRALDRMQSNRGVIFGHGGAYSPQRHVESGFAYLVRTQRSDGSWLPLWFGNQHAPDDENPTYGTARVLAAYRDLGMMDCPEAAKGVAWLLTNQNDDGGWGGGQGTPSSIEETALALDVLIDLACNQASGKDPESSPSTSVEGTNALRAPVGADSSVAAALTTRHAPVTTHRSTAAVNRGLRWLVHTVEAGGLGNPAPIGFYFAKLWYFEKLYPIVFSVAALGRARRLLNHQPENAPPE
ncbi:MAG: prenyltransferase/squalene oxidase repeat-containing protein [Gemmataceae bacterium]